MNPSCHDARKERTAQDSGCMHKSFYKNHARNKKIEKSMLIVYLVLEKKMTLPGFEPGTDGFMIHHRNHCSIRIWINAISFPIVLLTFLSVFSC